jgi:hypothetical protein
MQLEDMEDEDEEDEDEEGSGENEDEEYGDVMGDEDPDYVRDLKGMGFEDDEEEDENEQRKVAKIK